MKRLLAISGPSNSGKTTLIEKLITRLSVDGLRVGAIKHDPHGHAQLDVPGKDSWRFREAGASVVQIVVPTTTTLSFGPGASPELFACDVVLAEGFKREPWPRIEVVPPDGVPLLTSGTLALVSEAPHEGGLPVFARNDVEGVAHFIQEHLVSLTTPVAVLAGGASRRMGRDKATIALAGGQTMVELAIAIGRSYSESVLVVSRHADLHRAPAESAGARYVADGTGEQHPATGIATALESSPQGAVLAISCDAPGLQSAVLRALDRAVEQPPAEFAAFAIGGRIHPLPGYYGPASLEPLRAIARAGEAVYTLAGMVSSAILSEHEARQIDPDLASFASINTPEELAAYLP